MQPQPPSEFLCPITQEIMYDPVVCSDGHSYDRVAIVQWLSKNKTSPLTNVQMNDNMIENTNLRILIREWHEKNNLPFEKTTGNANKNQNENKMTIENQNEQKKESTQNDLKKQNQSQIDVKATAWSESDEYSLLHVTINPPKLVDQRNKKKCAFILVLDTSGSMGDQVNLGSGETSTETPFSRIDLAIHSIRSFLETLSAEDTLALITFNTGTLIKLKPMKMTTDNKRQVSKCLDGLDPNGSTDMWGGIKTALTMAKEQEFADKNTFIALFTDGDATMVPPSGFVREIQNFLRNSPMQSGLTTLGFGYALDSQSLAAIAQEGNSLFGYIPDATMVGTTMVNVMSGSMSTFVNKTVVSVTAPSPIDSVLGGFKFNRRAPNIVDVEFGPIQYGQARNLVLRFEKPKSIMDSTSSIISVKVVCDGGSFKNELDSQITADVTTVGLQPNPTFEDSVQLCRSLYVDALATAMNKVGFSTEEKMRRNVVNDKKTKDAFVYISDILKRMKQLKAQNKYQDSPLLDGMIRDIESSDPNEGQVSKSFETGAWYCRWGCHYLSALRSANQLQQCANFKDPSVQSFGGPVFKEFQQIAQDAFCNLPPPKPTAIVIRTNPKAAPIAVPKTMVDYYQVSGGCFDGNSRVKLIGGLSKFVKDLRKEDRLENGAKIVCVARTKILDPENFALVRLQNDLLITPYHPVRVNGKWKFPAEFSKIEYNLLPKDDCFVYNLVLDSVHIAIVNGIECVTLAHGFKGDKVIEHEYFGTNRVLNDLSRMNGWNKGFVELDQNNHKRDPISKLVIGMN